MIGKRQVQNKPATSAFFSFSGKYQQSARNFELRQRALQNPNNNTTEENKVVKEHGLPPLPTAPFKHDEEEMKTITFHIKALLERVDADDNAKTPVRACRAMIEKNTYDRILWTKCSKEIYQIGQIQAQNKEVTTAFYFFSRKYRSSASKASFQSGLR